jgi:hypothetical protein
MAGQMTGRRPFGLAREFDSPNQLLVVVRVDASGDGRVKPSEIAEQSQWTTASKFRQSISQGRVCGRGGGKTIEQSSEVESGPAYKNRNEAAISAAASLPRLAYIPAVSPTPGSAMSIK